MTDHQWQQAFDAGRAEAEGLVEALEQISETWHPQLNQRGYVVRTYDPSNVARTALAKYREQK